MNIGILTLLYKNYNYGGVLQAYALAKKLEQEGHDVEQILYKTESELKPSNVHSFKDVLNSIIDTAINVSFIGKARKVRFQKFDRFISEYIPCSDPVKKNQLNEYVKRFDCIITGSDQVWNPNWLDTSYLLDFIDNNKVTKISYAASIGVNDIPDNLKGLYQKCLSDFSYISVREERLHDILKNLLHHDIKCVLDPTMLLDLADWEEIITRNVCKEDYVFCYFLGNVSKQLRKEIKQFARNRKCKVVSMPYLTGKRSANWRLGDINMLSVSPQEFLGLIYDAKFVITDSFHAGVFSSLFAKPFAVVDRKQHNQPNSSSRLMTLLKLTGQENRMYEINNTLEMIGDILVKDLLENLKEYRQDSINFINEWQCRNN